MKSVFEQNGGTYTKVGDYYLPNLTVPTDKAYIIGKYGRIHGKFIKENYPCRYSSMLIQGTWLDYLERIDRAASVYMQGLIKIFADKMGISEELKATDQMKWVCLMNSAKAQAEEIIYKNMIYAGRNF